MLKPAAVLVLAIILAACEGAVGPTGPAGPQGPQGPAGTPHYFSATVRSDGSAVVAFPPAAGTLTTPPALTCLLRAPGGDVWLVIAFDNNVISCGLTTAGGPLSAVMIGAPPGWQALFVAVY